MKLLSWVKMRNHVAVDVDGAYGFQCVDLVNDYLDQVKSLPRVAGNAIDIQHDLIKGAVWVPNSPINSPSAGDVVVWGLHPYGHTAIAIAGDGQVLISFDQNWSGHGYADLVIHNYLSVLGWHHF